MRSLNLSVAFVFLVMGSQGSLAAAQDVQHDIEMIEAQLKKMGAKRLVDDGAKASFSPDGKQLVYSKMPFGAGIAFFDLKSGKSTDLIGSGKDPAYSHGEKPLIAYVRGDGREEEVWVIQPDGVNNRKVGDGGFPTWSGDGKTLYFHSRKLQSVMAVDLSAEEPQPVELRSKVASWYPAVSPEASSIAMVIPGTFLIADLEEPGYSARRLPGFTRGGLTGWSADGKLVGYGGYGYDDQVGLWVYDMKTNKARKIIDGPCTMPAWSKDGARLIFDFRPARDRHEIWMIDTKALAPEET